MRQPLQSCYRPSQDFSYSELSSPSLRSFNSLSLVSQTQSEERLWLPDEKTSRFVQKLHQTEEALGGKHLAYTNEKKTSQFVYQLLDHICKEYNRRNTKASMFIEMEGAITLFDERIVPDLLVMQRDFQNDKVRPIFVIEVKRTIKSPCGQDNMQLSYSMIHTEHARHVKHSSLRPALDQNFKQLRHVCIQNKLPECYGILTNHREWIFTKYNMN